MIKPKNQKYKIFNPQNQKTYQKQRENQKNQKNQIFLP